MSVKRKVRVAVAPSLSERVISRTEPGADGSVAQSATYDHQGRLSGQASIEAAAIAAAALLKLAAANGNQYRAAAEHVIDALAARHLAAHGGLRDGCYEQRNGLATSNELIWGDYFLLEALLALDGVIRPGTL
jgi:hypothetical protein